VNFDSFCVGGEHLHDISLQYIHQLFANQYSNSSSTPRESNGQDRREGRGRDEEEGEGIVLEKQEGDGSQSLQGFKMALKGRRGNKNKNDEGEKNKKMGRMKRSSARPLFATARCESSSQTMYII
tara:strand:- start:914 stop:1288 length:375 start_codon:yes stop_codon:yes gene_type:complete